MPYCPRCDAAVDPDGTHCEECGAALRGDVEPRTSAELPAGAPSPGAGRLWPLGLPPDSSLPQERGRAILSSLRYPVSGDGAASLLLVGGGFLAAAVLALFLSLFALLWILLFDGTWGLLIAPALLVVVPAVVGAGYAVSLADGAAGGAAVPPPLSGAYGYLVEGVYAVVALAPWAVAVGVLSVATGGVLPLQVVVALVSLYCLPAVAGTYATTGDVRTAYAPGRVVGTAASTGYVLAWLRFLPVLVATLFVAAVTTVLPLFLPFGLTYVVYVWAGFWGIAFYRLRRRGTVPEPRAAGRWEGRDDDVRTIRRWEEASGGSDATGERPPAPADPGSPGTPRRSGEGD